MVGHHSARYERYGWASARLDDVAGWVPARVTALLVVLVRPRRPAGSCTPVAGDAPAHPSPNAGVAEAAFAAALGLRLGGPTATATVSSTGRGSAGAGRRGGRHRRGRCGCPTMSAWPWPGPRAGLAGLRRAARPGGRRPSMIPPAGEHGGDGARLAAALGVAPSADPGSVGQPQPGGARPRPGRGPPPRRRRALPRPGRRRPTPWPRPWTSPGPSCC